MVGTEDPCEVYFSNTPDTYCGQKDVRISYTYCNCNVGNGEDIVVYPQKTYGLYRAQPVIASKDVKELAPGTCDTFEFVKRVNTCTAFPKGEMTYNGYNKKFGPGDDKSVCYAFYRKHWTYPRVSVATYWMK